MTTDNTAPIETLTDAETADPATDTDEAPTDASTTAPPWGDDFDPARAWQTISKLREGEKELKARLGVAERDLATATSRATAAEAATLAARREALIARASLPDTLHPFVTANDEDGIAAQVETLRNALTEGASNSRRPQAAVIPGHGGEDDTPHNADAIVAGIR
ncbi:hypothetical protein AB1K54_06220 [Microbacterium sp. BWT-B31]|uniref:hypothetical protein n=1 Tax=Microbacterium sp. BWT-B31 TaxID=3232072 RepID=UPI003528FB8A